MYILLLNLLDFLELCVLDGASGGNERLNSLFSSWHKCISQTDLPFS